MIIHAINSYYQCLFLFLGPALVFPFSVFICLLFLLTFFPGPMGPAQCGDLCSKQERMTSYLHRYG